MRILHILLLLQAALTAVLCFGDIGFDKPGRYGLDFNAGVTLVTFYAAALLVGIVVAIRLKRFWWLGIQVLPILCVGGYRLLPDPHFDASHYQFLVGKSRVELRQAIGTEGDWPAHRLLCAL